MKYVLISDVQQKCYYLLKNKLLKMLCNTFIQEKNLNMLRKIVIII